MYQKLVFCATLPLVIVAAMTLSGCTSAKNIHWADLVRFQGITYQAEGNGQTLSSQLVGPQYAKVHYRLDGNVQDANYQLKDGDATYLDSGTSVFAVIGYQPTFRLAAKEGNTFHYFDVISNPSAHRGADVLNINEKVMAVGITSDGTHEISSITNQQELDTLVKLIAQAPLSTQSASTNDTDKVYFLIFHLNDGTQATRRYDETTSTLSPPILILPSGFSQIIKQADGSAS